MGRGSIDIRMLGGFELRDQRGELIALSVRKAEALLALLALEPGRAQTRSKLCGMLWPNVPEDQARHSLRQALVSIRKAAPQAIIANVRTLALDANHTRVDVAEVLQLLASGSQAALDRVAHVYTGELLDGLSIAEEPFEQWLTLERERIRALVADGLRKLAEQHAARAAFNEALQVSTRVMQLDPLHEPGVRACMHLLARLGRRAEALQQYRSFVELLRQSLDAEPEPETKQLFLELGSSAMPERAPRIAAPATLPRAAPAPLELEAATTYLRSTELAPRAAAPATLLREPPAAPLQLEAAATYLRAAELSQLRAAHAEAAERIEVCLVQGEAGVGKSHLCAQLSQLLAAEGCSVLNGRCFESEQVLPFACWADLLQLARLADDTTTLNALRGETKSELARILPQLGAAPPAEAASSASAMFQALTNVLEHWSQTGPLCIVLEDLQWADEMSLRFLCFAARRLQAAHGCLIVSSMRSEPSGAHAFLPSALAELERDGRLRHVPLAPLSYAQTRRLAEDWAQKLALHLQGSLWFERIWSLSEGNALVVVESARALTQQDAALELSSLSVPERVRALIRRRLTALSAPTRELASIAAVYGRELDPQLLAAVTSQAEAQRGIAELLDAQLVSTQDGRTLFTHDRVRETLYAELPSATLQLIHGRLAAALTPNAVGAVLGQAGYHHAKAGNAEAAVTLLEQFAEYARRTHALGEAMSALEEATRQAYALLPERRPHAVTQLAVRQAFCMMFLGRPEGMIELLQGCADLAELVEDTTLAASYHYWRGFALMLLGRGAEALEHAERSLGFAARGDDRRLHGSAHNLAAHQYLMSAQFSKGSEHAERALELLRSEQDPESRMFAYMNVSLNRAAQGQLDSGLALALHAEQWAADSGSERSLAMATVTTGLIQIMMHRWEMAATSAHRTLAASKTPFTFGAGCALLAVAQLAAGQAEPAAALLETIVTQIPPAQRATHHQVAFMVLHAEALLRTGAVARARQIAAEAVQSAQVHEHIGLGFALRTLGLAELRLHDLTGARTHLEAALACYERLNIPLASAIMLRALSELDHVQLGAAGARARLADAHALYCSIDHSEGARQVAEWMQSLEAHSQPPQYGMSGE